MNPNYEIVLEVIAWITCIVLAGKTILILETAGIAKSILRGELHGKRTFSENEADSYLGDIEKRWHLIWIIPIVFISTGYIGYRQLYVHPDSTIFSLKVLTIVGLIIAIFAILWTMNYCLSIIHGPEKDKIEAQWQQAADDYARICGTEYEKRQVNLAQVQERLKLQFFYFIALLAITEFAAWFLFF